MSAPADAIPAARGVRTTRRRGRLSGSALDTLHRLGPAWSLTADDRWTIAGLDRAFGRRGRRLLDVGVGDGRASLAWAEANPDADLIAIEVHRPGVSRLLAAIDAGDVRNVRVSQEDATEVVAALEAGAVEDVRVLFPDPWPKRRHVDRRLVDAGFVRTVADVLPPGGTLHVATDWDELADHVRAALATDPRLAPEVLGEVDGRWWSSRPERPVTTYEGRGLAAGRRITDLLVRRV